MWTGTESKVKLVYKNHNLLMMTSLVLMTVLISGAPVEDKYHIGRHLYCSQKVWLVNFTTVRNYTMQTSTIRYKLQMTPQEYQFMKHKRHKIIESKSFCIA